MDKKKYSNDEITVVWQHKMCTHSTKCWKGLGEVFKPKERPWVNMDGASTEAIMAQVDKCPSGALSYFKNGEEPQETEVIAAAGTRVECAPDGPLMVYGQLDITLPDGAKESKMKVTAFCRCGASGNKPYCDGSHNKVEFKG